MPVTIIAHESSHNSKFFALVPLHHALGILLFAIKIPARMQKYLRCTEDTAIRALDA